VTTTATVRVNSNFNINISLFFLGEFVLLDSKTFKVKGKWNAEGSKTEFNYDYWYQPRKNVMLSTEWGSPNKIKTGFNPMHVGEGEFFGP
jgi:selenium-binding protein 1